MNRNALMSRPRGLTVIAIAASSGGLAPLREIVSRLPAGLGAAVLVVSHVPRHRTSRLPTILSAAGPLPATHARHGDLLRPGRIVVAPSDRHLAVSGGRVCLTTGPREHGVRPAADVLFRSLARAAGGRAIAIVLSGTGRDGAAGLLAVERAGGVTVVQEPSDAEFTPMPEAALAAVEPTACLPATAIAAFVEREVRQHGAAAPTGCGRRSRARARGSSLNGLRVLVAEDDYLIASDVVGMLGALGCEAVGPVADLAAGLRLLEADGSIDCAVLDVDLRGTAVFPLAAALRERGVPVVFATGFAAEALTGPWASWPRVEKPFPSAALRGALRAARSASARAGTPSAPRPSPAPAPGPLAETLRSSRNGIMRSRLLRRASEPTDAAPAGEGAGETAARALTRAAETLQHARAVLVDSEEAVASSNLRRSAARRTMRRWLCGEQREDDPGSDP